MELTINTTEKQPTFKRTNITATVLYEGATPSRKVLRDELAKKSGSKADKLVIKHIGTHFGENRVSLTAAVYDDADTMKALEHKNTVEKHVKKEEPKASEESKEEAPKSEEKTEEAPATEEKKEE